MKLHIGVDEYVRYKQQLGYQFENGQRYLSTFGRRSGDIELAQVNTQQVLSYLDNCKCASRSRFMKHRVLDHFFTYWSDRDQMPVLALPPAKPPARQTFVPHVFGRSEIRALLRAAKPSINRQSAMEYQTLQMFLLFLYGTGASVGEALLLECADVDPTAGLIRTRTRSQITTRVIPIGKELREAVRKYAAWRWRRNYKNPRFFVTKMDRPISRRGINKYFVRDCSKAGLRRRDGSPALPRILDLRYAFAVHRIAFWIKNNADLNRMLPALAAYLGQRGLGAVERYMSMTPERHRRELKTLSPKQGQSHWRNDKALMKFLEEL